LKDDGIAVNALWPRTGNFYSSFAYNFWVRNEICVTVVN
jgi:hypothetical protein